MGTFMGPRRVGSSGRRAGNQSLSGRRCVIGSPLRPGKAQLVPVGIGDVEKALAPFGVARRAVGPASGGDEPGVEGVDIVVVEDQPPPPRPAPVGWLEDQVEKIVAGAENGEGSLLAAVDDRQLEE